MVDFSDDLQDICGALLRLCRATETIAECMVRMAGPEAVYAGEPVPYFEKIVDSLECGLGNSIQDQTSPLEKISEAIGINISHQDTAGGPWEDRPVKNSLSDIGLQILSSLNKQK